MQEKLRALVRLAEIDASARHIEDQLHGIPAELDERRTAVSSLEALVGGQKVQMDEAVKLLEQQQADITMRSGLLAKSKAKSAKARNMREAEAAERELDAIRRSIRDAEEERDRLQGVIDKTRAVLDQPLSELQEQKSALDLAQDGSDEKLAALKLEHEAKIVGRAEQVKLIPKPVYRRYERIRPQIRPAVVMVVDGVCQGCRMHIPPQLYNQIVRADDFYQCQACQRFLYHPSILDEDGVVEAAPEA